MSAFKKALLLAKQNKVALAIAAGTVANTAMAAATPPDTTELLAYLAAASITVAAVANAKLLMELGVKAFHWIRRALGG